MSGVYLTLHLALTASNKQHTDNSTVVASYRYVRVTTNPAQHICRTHLNEVPVDF